VELIKARYPQANNQAPLLAEYRACGATFGERWQAFSDRRAIAQAAVTKAVELAAAGQHAEAVAALQAVVTPVDAPAVDHLGRMAPLKRDLLEVRDAELPAVIALAVLAVEQRMMHLLPDLRVAFLARRRVSSAEPAERIQWLANHCGAHVRKSQGRFYGFGAGQKPEAHQAVEKVLGACGDAMDDGAKLAKGFFQTLPEHGVTFVELGSKAAVPAGQWVILEVAPTKVTNKKLSYKKKDQWTEGYDCVPSDTIVGIHPVTGRFVYALRCKTRVKQEVITLTAALVEAATIAKAPGGGFAPVWLLGKLKAAGPKWALTEASVVALPAGAHLKFLGPGL
jgi:hypothetical protein